MKLIRHCRSCELLRWWKDSWGSRVVRDHYSPILSSITNTMMLQLSIRRAKLKFLMPQISALGNSHFSTAAQSSSSNRNALKVPNLIGGRLLDSKSSNFRS